MISALDAAALDAAALDAAALDAAALDAAALDAAALDAAALPTNLPAGVPPLLHVLKQVPDFRSKQGKRYPLEAILALGIAATLCALLTQKDIARQIVLKGGTSSDARARS